MGCPIEREKSDSHSSARKTRRFQEHPRKFKHMGMEYGNDAEVVSQAACLLVHSGTEMTSQKLLKYI